MDDLFHGKLVRLAADDPETLGKAFSRWDRNSGYKRLMDTEPPQLWSAKSIKDWMEKDIEKEKPDEYFFTIHILDNDQLIGFVAFAASTGTSVTPGLASASASLGIGVMGMARMPCAWHYATLLWS